MKPKFSPSFKPTVIVPKETAKPIRGAVRTGDTVIVGEITYPIADKSLSIKGYKEYYTIRGHALGSGVRIMNQIECMGENEYCRPYKPGDTVTGKINDNQKFVITAISKR